MTTFAELFASRPAAPVAEPKDLMLLAVQRQVDEAVSMRDFAFPVVSALPPTELFADDEYNEPFEPDEVDIGLDIPDLDTEKDTSSFGLEAYFGDISADNFDIGPEEDGPRLPPTLPPVDKALDGVRKIVKPGFTELSRFGAPALEYDPQRAELHNMLRRLIRGMQG